jgi:hypothetical protein
LNNKKLPIKTTSAIFLAVVLVIGTIAVSSPSFMVGAAQAQPYHGQDKKYSDYESDYEMNIYDKKSYEQESYGKDSYEQDYPSYKSDYSSYDKDSDKSKDSSNSVNIKKLKCNNINANLNNVDASFGSPPIEDDTNGANGGVGSEALAAQGGEAISANGLMNGDRSFVDRENDFAFVCINNNNNTVVEGEETPAPPVEECAEAEDIEACFEEHLIFPENFVTLTEALENGLDVVIQGEPVTLNSFADICLVLKGIPFAQLEDAIAEIVFRADIEAFSIDLDDCIAEALGIPVP